MFIHFMNFINFISFMFFRFFIFFYSVAFFNGMGLKTGGRAEAERAGGETTFH